MEPIGFAMSLLPPLPQEMILAHHPWRPLLTGYTHIRMDDRSGFLACLTTCLKSIKLKRMLKNMTIDCP